MLSLLVIKTREPEKLKAFYEKIGLSFTEERHGNGPLHYATTAGKTVFEIYPLPKSVEVADTTTRLGFSVANLDAVFSLLSKEYTIVSAPAKGEWGYSAIVKDPDGRSVEISEDRK